MDRWRITAPISVALTCPDPRDIGEINYDPSSFLTLVEISTLSSWLYNIFLYLSVQLFTQKKKIKNIYKLNKDILMLYNDTVDMGIYLKRSSTRR